MGLVNEVNDYALFEYKQTNLNWIIIAFALGLNSLNIQLNLAYTGCKVKRDT
jgi:hypothetical protein